MLEVDGDGEQIAENIYGIYNVSRVINGENYTYLHNGHGDVVALIDSEENAVNRYTCDAFGVVLTSTETVSNPFRYAGYWYDSETGLYYLMARYYNPVNGRFLSEDPARDGYNWYVYCDNNPLMYVDPSGLIGILPDGSIYMDEGDTEIDKRLLEYKIVYDDPYTTKAEKRIIAKKAAELRENNPNKYKVMAEDPLEIFYIPDYTEILNEFMEENESEFSNHQYDFLWFANHVKTGALVDVKNSNDKFKRSPKSYHIIYDDVVFRADAPGNIAYGYLGKAAGFSDDILLYGAGIYQTYSDVKVDIKESVNKVRKRGILKSFLSFNVSNESEYLWNYVERMFDNYGDNPGDPEQIMKGIEIYSNVHS